MLEGFIHDELDIMVLILYVLRRLPAEIDGETLADTVQVDGGFTYFDFKQCLTELVKTAQVEENDNCYRITAKGNRNCEILETSLPYTVRRKADKSLSPVAEDLRRSAMLFANHEAVEKGVMVYLGMNDDLGSVMDLKLLVPDEERAKKIEKYFKKNAESVYQHFVEALSN